MKFYYEATHHIPYEDEGLSFLCSSEIELKKGNYVIVFLHDDIGFTLAEIHHKVSEVEALTKKVRPIEIIQIADKIEAYKAKLDSQIKLNALRLDLEEKAKEVKAIESFRKLAMQNREFKDLFDVFEQLEKASTASTQPRPEF